MSKTSYAIPNLFELENLENMQVLKAANLAHRKLGQLRGMVRSIPSYNILLTTLPLREAKESSEIENIITTYDDMYQSNYDTQDFTTQAAKEVHYYAQAISYGMDKIRETGLISLNLIVEIQKILVGNNAGLRKQAGTGLVNQQTGETIYTPPQNSAEILALMSNLEKFINDSACIDYDPLIKMALIHHQFESVHPFYDGNGRTGRIVNILYLVQQKVLDSPVLYLSAYINKNKQQYYKLLQEVRATQNWQNWLIFMLTGIGETAEQTSNLILAINQLMQEYEKLLKEKEPKIYSPQLLHNLFKHPYTKIDFVVRDCQLHRNTASKYLDLLTKHQLVKKVKIGKDNFYINTKLFNLLSET